MTEKELRLLLEILDLKLENARLIKDQWENVSDEEYVDNIESLRTEQEFSRGVHLGWSEARTLIKNCINA